MKLELIEICFSSLTGEVYLVQFDKSRKRILRKHNVTQNFEYVFQHKQEWDKRNSKPSSQKRRDNNEQH